MAELKSEIVSKKRLTKSEMQSFQVRGGFCRKYIILQLTIKSFFQMKNYIGYERDIINDVCSLTLIVTKIKRDVTAVIISDSNILVEAYVNYGDHKSSLPINPKVVYKEVFEVEFSSSVISDPRNTSLKKGELCLVFKLEWGIKLLKMVLPFIGSKIRNDNSFVSRSEEEIISRSVAKYMENYSENHSKFEDFVILVDPGQGKILAHKAILATRSEYIKEYLIEHGQSAYGLIISDIPLKAVKLVLIFLYCGKINIDRTEEMLDVLHLSMIWKITNLAKLSINYLHDNIRLLNAEAIKSTAEELGIESLVLAANNYLKKYNSILASCKL